MANERIFISYKRVNKEPVFALIDRIERELGVKCWVDLDGIETSAQFASKICTAIDRAEVVLFMHSSAHLDIDYDNDWTVRELNYAHSENKHVVLVKLDNAPLKNIFNLIYGTRNNIDSRNPDQWNILMRDLRKWLNLEAPKTQPTPPQPKLQPTPKPTPTTSKTPLQELEERLARLDKEVGNLTPFKDYLTGKYGFKDKTGKVVIPCTWDNTLVFSEGLAGVKDSNGKWGYIDKTGKVVIPYTWKDALYFTEGLAAVQDSNYKWGFIDKTGKVVTPNTWYNCNAPHFREGLAAVLYSNGKYGFIDKTGKVTIPCTWKNAWDFTEGLAGVKDSNGKWGFIDKTGKVIIHCTWDYAYDFENGRAKVMRKVGLFGIKKEWHEIDKTGNVISIHY